MHNGRSCCSHSNHSSSSSVFRSWNFNSHSVLFFLLMLAVAILERGVDASGKRRLCGKVLTNEVKRLCTPSGYALQCIHSANNYASVQQKRFYYGNDNDEVFARKRRSTDSETSESQRWLREFLRLPTMSKAAVLYNEDEEHHDRHKAAIHKRHGIAQECCAGAGCDREFLESFCCDDDELEEFKRQNKPDGAK
ncbi:hypothetical protein DdX_10219 [Ditylenchus destructor]|uniref:Insulin-like domain-containing protein n=1 Tax=Ditylenchus destructor TaxID=166010 RepID=A0AAD4MZ59_9BILA|nr:hypothetical protein DdX_10219 [Ditylenchus destructor]